MGSRSIPSERGLLIGCVILFSKLGFILGGTVCYGDIGCFDNFPPFWNAAGLLPKPPDAVGTTFSLFTRRTTDVFGELLSYSDSNANAGTTFNPKLPVKIIVHGFSIGNEPWIEPMKNAFLQKLDCNVITTNWKKGAAMPDYLAATANTRLVGRQMAMLIRQLQKIGLSLDKVHILGLSLGSHIAGYAGSELFGQVGRITGLDPAGPLFEGLDPRVRLDPGDGKFVDVIHTNGVPLILGGFGITTSVGHVDFYPNGGKFQPGCAPVFIALLQSSLLFNIEEAVWKTGCHHLRSVHLFTDSITASSCRYLANGCSSGYADFLAGMCSDCKTGGCSEMGYNADKYSARGDMYLSTKDSAPYCAK